MLILASTSDILRVVTGAAADVEVHASYMDNNAGTVTPGRANTASIVTATTTTVVASPGAGIQRNVKHLNITNNHATVSCTVAVEHFDGTNSERLMGVNLLAGENLVLDEKGTWTHYDVNGAKYDNVMTGRYLGTTVITAGTTFTTKPETRTIFARVQGAGGGGGGCTSVAAAAAAGGGGSAGAYAEKTFTVAGNTTYAVAIGAAGAGVSGAAGNNGGATSIGPIGGVTVSAPGGIGGPVATAATTLTARAGGASPAIATGGDVNLGGEPGAYGVVLIVATPIVASGAGGSSEFGAGGVGIVAVGNGVNAVGAGAGGGGSATGASAVRTGGNGGAGQIVIDEYS